ncbi:MAG TPA: hypothetical protein VLM40_13765 [Gemmata sp.]|nr:hypothetical protein [Gemmata sp.]
MDHSKLRQWLGLPPGVWPPDHYSLLGLPIGQCDPAAIEPIVLARMERLREHQLLHPELVTEGMNRLAQALICLTDPIARISYDAALGLPGHESNLRRPSLPVQDAELLLDQPPAPAAAPAAVENPPVEPLQLPPAYEVMWEDTPEKSDDEILAIVEATLVAPAPGVWQPRRRRDIFARLVRVRGVLTGWQKLETTVGDPREPLDRPARVLLFLEAIAEVLPAQKLLPELIGGPGKAGWLVATLIAQPLVLHTFRSLLPDQRRTLAMDWRRAQTVLLEERALLRQLVRDGRRSHPRRGGWRALNWLLRTPEAILLILAAIAMVVVWFRVAPR